MGRFFLFLFCATTIATFVGVSACGGSKGNDGGPSAVVPGPGPVSGTIEGVWRWESQAPEGGAVLRHLLRLQGGRYALNYPPSELFVCNGPYRIDGTALVATAVPGPGCPRTDLRLEILSLTDRELVLRAGSGVTTRYGRVGVPAGPGGTPPAAGPIPAPRPVPVVPPTTVPPAPGRSDF